MTLARTDETFALITIKKKVTIISYLCSASVVTGELNWDQDSSYVTDTVYNHKCWKTSFFTGIYGTHLTPT